MAPFVGPSIRKARKLKGPTFYFLQGSTTDMEPFLRPSFGAERLSHRWADGQRATDLTAVIYHPRLDP